MQILNEDVGETLWDVAVKLLCTLMSFFPSSIRQHYDTVEAVLTSKIMAAKCDLNTSKKFSLGLAILPKVKGDEESFCLIIEKILIAINSILTDAFQGLEEEKKSSEVMRMIVPPGKDPPPPLGGQTLPGEAFEPATRRLSELLVPRVTTLMHSCCVMLTNPYPFPVSIPVRPLIATVRRVLQVDGSFHGTLFPLITSTHQELLCAVLPALHLGCLDFLIAIIKGLRSQLLPHGANVVRLLTEYFRRARMPSIRRKVYSIVQMLLISMGVGMSLYLAQEVINNAFADLTDNLELGSSAMLSNMQSSILVGGTFRQNYHKKRKRDASVIPVEHSNGVDLSVKTCSKKSQAPLSVKIAALKALEALLTMGGSLKSECWRPDVDFLVIIVATNAFDSSWANENRLCLLKHESSFVDYQLATLEVLLASLLSPTHTRSPYLSQGLDLFRRGRQETGSKIATFCAHALLALEVLIHPRSLPLEDHPPPNNLSVGEGFNQSFASGNFNNSTKTNLPSFSKGDLGLLDEEDEEELSSGSFDEEGPTSLENRNLNDKHNSEDIMEKPLANNSEVSHHVLEYEDKFSQNVGVEMEGFGSGETTIDKEKTEESTPRNEISFHNASHNKMDFGQGNSAVFAAEMTLWKSESLVNIPVNMSNHGSNAPDLSIGKIKEDSSPRSLYKGKDAMLSYDSDSFSLDSLPDIVDGDPDSE
ncbi:proline-, glutamic acid- and leucine-rich protein 1-like isoform X2 [Dendrobium catenatum]|nr:proline-, glutamic acid- and leucine-rich protein 1-like isoform X2 [Dendrobium catenatum]